MGILMDARVDASTTPDTLTFYTDGSYAYPHGGWAWVLVIDGREIETGSGHTSATTNNRMELFAILKALIRAMRHTGPVTIRTDSQYAIRAITNEWLEPIDAPRIYVPVELSAFALKRFRGGVNNADLINQIRSIIRPGIQFVWQKGHIKPFRRGGRLNPGYSDHAGFNNRADQLAGLARTSGANRIASPAFMPVSGAPNGSKPPS